jgi:hypothetical protein
MMMIGCSGAADDSNIARHRQIKSNIVLLLSFQAKCSRRQKAVRLGAMGTRRNAGALPRGERYLRLVEAIPVSSNARAHACNQIDSQGVLQAYFIKRDVFALAHPARPN